MSNEYPSTPFIQIPQHIHDAAATLDYYFESKGAKYWEFAHLADRRWVNKLERERDELHAVLLETQANLQSAMERYQAENQCTSNSGADVSSCSAVTVPREQYEALLRDKERLDYLEAAHAALNERYGTNYGWKLIINHNVVRFMAGNSHPHDNGFPGIDLPDSNGGNAKLPTCRDAIDKYLAQQVITTS